MTPIIDLNADAGEGFGAYAIGADAEMLDSVTSLNVACGFHAGDPVVIRQTIRAAAAAGVSIGAHPGFPDLQGFGRRPIHIAPGDLVDMLIYQIGAVAALAAAEGQRLRHVKAHGAVYNMAVNDAALGDAIAEATAAFPGLWLYAMPGSAMATAAAKRGVRVAVEAFLDRGYRPDGSLVPRSQPGALLTDPHTVSKRAVSLATDGVLVAADGTRLPIQPRTLCIHSDTPGAGTLAAAARAALGAAGVRLAPPEA